MQHTHIYNKPAMMKRRGSSPSPYLSSSGGRASLLQSPPKTSIALPITRSTPPSSFRNATDSNSTLSKSSIGKMQTALKASLDNSPRRDTLKASLDDCPRRGKSRLHPHSRLSTTSTTSIDDDSRSSPPNISPITIDTKRRTKTRGRNSANRRERYQAYQDLRSFSGGGCIGAKSNKCTRKARAAAGLQALPERSSSYHDLRRNTYGPLPGRSASYNDAWSDESSLDNNAEPDDDATIIASGNSSKSKLAANNLDICDETEQSDLPPNEIEFLPSQRRRSKSMLRENESATAKKRSTAAAERFALMHLWEKEDDFPKQKNPHPRSA